MKHKRYTVHKDKFNPKNYILKDWKNIVIWDKGVIFNLIMPESLKHIEMPEILKHMKTIDENYLEIIKKCKFVAKPNGWFVEGTEVTIEDDVIYPKYEQGNRFNEVCGLFNGLTMETFKGHTGELPRQDGETCPFDEFFIFDEFGNDITELTLEEYELLIN